MVFNQTTENVELWYNGTLVPNGPLVEEFKQTGHYSDPELMEVFVDLERRSVNFYCVIACAEQNNEAHYRFDTLILRKDEEKPEVAKLSELAGVKIELRKLHLQMSDGFNIPATIEQPVG